MGFFDFFKKKKETAMDEIKTKCIERPDYVEECFLVERFDDDECSAVYFIVPQIFRRIYTPMYLRTRTRRCK